MQKYANKICKNMQNICKNIRVYVFAYGAYICTPHFADVVRESVSGVPSSGDSLFLACLLVATPSFWNAF